MMVDQRGPVLRGWWSVPLAMVAAIATAIFTTLIEVLVTMGGGSLELLGFVSAFVAVLITVTGIFCGLPLWAAMHVLGYRNPAHAAATGVATAAAGLMLLGALRLGGPFVDGLGRWMAYAALPGAWGGVVFHLIAYRSRP